MASITGKEPLETIKIDELTLDPKFGSLIFQNANKKLEKIRKWLIELDQLDYKGQLPENIIEQINNEAQKFDQHIEWLRNFDITTSGNPKADHDSFEGQIDAYFNSFYNNLVVSHLNYLKRESENQSADKRKLADEQKQLSEIRKSYEKIVEDIRNKTEQISKAKVEQAAKSFGKHFEIQAKINQTEANKWLIKRNSWFWCLMIVISINLIFYIYLFITFKIGTWPFMKPSDFFTLEYGLVKLAIISLLSYAISFASRNFNVNSNLVSLENHRKNVAETLNDFLITELEKDDRSKIVEKATDAMFTHRPIGYLPKIESRDEGPVSSFINLINPLKQ